MAQIATIVFAVGIAGLFWLDRDRKIRTSGALWIPVIWLLIVGSRPVSVWLNMAPSNTADMILDGGPVDRFIFAVLLAAGIVVLIHRSSRASSLLRTNWPIMLYFFYCLVSISWSDFPGIAFKRWIKAIGDLVMVLIIVTDANPAAALKRFLARTGFILLPASVLLIKYFDHLGRTYDGFTGAPVNIGVTTNKNSLGVITLVLSMGALWRILTLLRYGGQPNRGRHLLAQGVLLTFGISLLASAHSVTSGASFALGSGLMLATGLRVFKRRPAAIHALFLAILIVGGLAVLYGNDAITQALGRKSDLTGRTEIWDKVIPMVPNTAVGAGFESFWLGPRLVKIWRAFPVFLPNEAHNGYIEVYLNLGWVGVGLMVVILVTGYTRVTRVFARDPAMCGLLMGYVVVAAIYSSTEAGFRLLDPIWIFLLLAVVAAGGAASGRADGDPFNGWHGRSNTRKLRSADQARSSVPAGV